MTSTAPSLSRFLGGTIGRHARPGGLWFTAGPWAFLALTASWLVLMLRQIPCLHTQSKFPNMCYSDISVLYYWRGLKDGQIPYLESELEYPVLTGGFMELSRRLVLMLGGQSRPGLSSEEVSHAAGLFVGVNAVLLFVLFGVLIWAHLKLHRPWDALMIAAAVIVYRTGPVNRSRGRIGNRWIYIHRKNTHRIADPGCIDGIGKLTARIFYQGCSFAVLVFVRVVKKEFLEFQLFFAIAEHNPARCAVLFGNKTGTCAQCFCYTYRNGPCRQCGKSLRILKHKTVLETCGILFRYYVYTGAYIRIRNFIPRKSGRTKCLHGNTTRFGSLGIQEYQFRLFYRHHIARFRTDGKHTGGVVAI